MGTVLVTGATGFIGSNVCAALIGAGHDVVGVDDFSNSSPDVAEVVSEVAGHVDLVEADVRDPSALHRAFADRRIDSVVHLAGVKSVEESTIDPLRYYDINVAGTINLLRAMSAANARQLVFSSSCTVYGNAGGSGTALDEFTPIAPTSPYGRSKAAVEQILMDLASADSAWSIISLRYFNPAGADASLRLGERPTTPHRSLIPLAIEAAAGRRSHIDVFGTDYPTPDGTCIRDYLHVADLADAHVASADALPRISGFEAINLGRETGSSVLEVIDTVEEVTDRPIERRMRDRRSGDATALFANASKARRLLDWKAVRSLEDVCRDHWNWYRRHHGEHV